MNTYCVKCKKILKISIQKYLEQKIIDFIMMIIMIIMNIVMIFIIIEMFN